MVDGVAVMSVQDLDALVLPRGKREYTVPYVPFPRSATLIAPKNENA